MRILAISLDPSLMQGLEQYATVVLHQSKMNTGSLEALDEREELRGYDAVVVDLCHTRYCWKSPALQRLRTAGFSLPIIGITRPTYRTDIVPWCQQRATFLEHGGDDLFKDPPDLRELMASLSSITRRKSAAAAAATVEFVSGAAIIILNAPTRIVTVNGRVVHLSPKEMDVLIALAARPGFVRSKAELLQNIYLIAADESEPKNIDTIVCRIRGKFRAIDQDAGNIIVTLRGEGYVIVSPANTKF